MISVLIPTRDRPGLLACALGSLTEQTCQDFEVIVVNDGGPGLGPQLAEWQERLPLTLIELDTRCGPAQARNIALERACGQYLAFLDDDDIFLPDHLEMAAKALSAEDLDLVYCRALVSNERVHDVPVIGPAARFKAYPFDERFLLIANYIHTSSIVVTNFAESTERFDESLNLCEDWDMWLSLRLRLGYRMGLVDKLTSVYHQVPDTPGSVSRANLASPSPFSVVRDLIYTKWPTEDHLVLAYRRWLTAFERYRNEWIEAGREIPANLFDNVLSHLYERFARECVPHLTDVPSVFDEGGA